MNLTIKTLEQIHEALESVEEARENIFLNPAEKTRLETAAIHLRNLERTIIRTQENELIEAMTSDSMALKDLVAEMQASAERLDAISGIIEKASKGVEAFIQILVTATSAGLL